MFWLSGVAWCRYSFSLSSFRRVAFDTPLYPSARNPSILLVNCSSGLLCFLRDLANSHLFPFYFFFLCYCPQGICHYFVFVVPSGMERLFCYPFILRSSGLDFARKSATHFAPICNYFLAVSYCVPSLPRILLISFCPKSLNWTLDCRGSFHPVVFKNGSLITIFSSILMPLSSRESSRAPNLRLCMSFLRY